MNELTQETTSGYQERHINMYLPIEHYIISLYDVRIIQIFSSDAKLRITYTDDTVVTINCISIEKADEYFKKLKYILTGLD